MAYIIAEIGFNHEGNLDLAQEMICAAADSGANAVKFQTFRAIDIALPNAEHFNNIKRAELSLDDHKRLAQVAFDKKVDFLSTPFSKWAVDLLENINVSAYKVASMDCTHASLLRYIARTKKSIYLSTGMASLAEIAQTLRLLKENKSGPITLLHCLSFYPAKTEQLNLRAIPFLKKYFNIPIGYSDHYPGYKACLAAYMLGAEVIESHFTLDTKKEGADHTHSLDPRMLRQLIANINLFEIMRGENKDLSSRPDRYCTKDYRRGVYFSRDIKKGEKVKVEDFLFCRPLTEFTPNEAEKLEGKVLLEDVSAYAVLRKEMLER